MIDAELYRVFYTVANCGNISTASRQLYVSQPAVSKSIKKLEELTGCTLFIRSSKGVALTSEGHILFDYVKNGFEYLDSGERVLKKIRNRETGLIKVGISTTLCKYILIPHLEEFHAEHPGIKISIINRTSGETLNLLKQGMIDFGIISLPENTSNLVCHELMSIKDIFVVAKAYQHLVKRQSLTSLQIHPLMMLEKGNVTRTYIDDFLSANNVYLQPEIEISSMDFLIEFAKIGLGIALVIKDFVKNELAQGLLFQVPVDLTIPPRKIGIARQQNLPLSIAAQTFIESITSKHS